MGGIMETQPTQQGLMQLFMGLGLSTANPLAKLGTGEKPDSTGFDSLLAGYLPNTTLVEPELLSDASMPILDPLISGETGLGTIDGVEGLPLEVLPIGNQLPLSSELDAELTSLEKPKSLKINNVDQFEALPEDDEKAQDLLENQGFYAQSLVSNTLPINGAAKTAVPQPLTSQSSIINDQHSAANALANLQARGAVNKGALDSSGSLSAANLSDLEGGDISESPEMDRFLGSQKKTLDPMSSSFNSVSPLQTSSPLNALSALPAQLMASAESSAGLALAMNEDPVQQSLQDLVAVEEGEKAEVEAKLLSTERKQDDQVLRLTKGQQAWGDALSERISMNAAKDIKNVTIHLDPPELGTLELKLQIKDDQQTQVQVQVQNPQVKEALESSANRLRDMLANEGLELSDFDVQTGSEQSAGEHHDSNRELADEQQNSDASFIDGNEDIEITLPKNNNLLDTFV
jgi:flagellar hook-length control protein FliK